MSNKIIPGILTFTILISFVIPLPTLVIAQDSSDVQKCATYDSRSKRNNCIMQY